MNPKTLDELKEIMLQEKWSNSDNALFYKNMTISYFRYGIKQAGLENYYDLVAIDNYIAKANSILEVGAGSGRVLDYLVDKNSKAKLYAIEREKKFCTFLKKKFASKVEIICEDLRSFETDKKFDLILWMWTGICEFARNEQFSILTKILSLLDYGGFLILDMLFSNTKVKNVMKFDMNRGVIQTNFGSDYVYLPTQEEVYTYIEIFGLNVKRLNYDTLASSKRSLLILSKI